ncbi:hypothetical protein BH10ACI3_BH10ACI3_14270 [soil metagenome]
MNRKCVNCRLVNYPNAVTCSRCEAELMESASFETPRWGRRSGIFFRAAVCVLVCLAALFGFYLSLIGTAKTLMINEKAEVRASIRLIREKGFSTEAMILENFTAFRSNDNWLNASVEKEKAYAATNFPFEIMTLYPDFFNTAEDETERAAVLLHESRHLLGEDEHDAYAYVWKNRKRLGWTSDKYYLSPVWSNVRRQTKEFVPELFVCDGTQFGDCTE